MGRLKTVKIEDSYFVSVKDEKDHLKIYDGKGNYNENCIGYIENNRVHSIYFSFYYATELSLIRQKEIVKFIASLTEDQREIIREIGIEQYNDSLIID